MTELTALGIETFTLDVQSDSSIAACVGQLSSLDILVNNAGATYTMPVSDLSIPQAKKLFDLNVWSYLAVTQAFLPLLLKSKGMIVNHTSSSSVLTIPFLSAYSASKAAMATFSDTQRLELEPFGITVVDLKSGSVKSNIMKNHKEMTQASLPKGSIYEPAMEAVEKTMSGEVFFESAMESATWAEGVAHDLLKTKPSPNIWTGGLSTWLIRLGTILPFGMLDGSIKSMTGLDIVKQKVQQ